mmetsp:Transcript_890/g.2926  ORF Transcript_890/g.2926 Transcript_890/m.2926 type:complete len:84 (-) Transcript_890:96-347(-)
MGRSLLALLLAALAGQALTVRQSYDETEETEELKEVAAAGWGPDDCKEKWGNEKLGCCIRACRRNRSEEQGVLVTCVTPCANQ